MLARLALASIVGLGAGLGLVGAGAGAAAADTRDGPSYVLEIVAPPPSKAGAAGIATVTVRPRGGWKLNTEYPFKLELVPGAGARVAKSVLRKADARRFGEGGADVDVEITADKAGQADVAATVKFATCDDATCAVHKESFTITATAR
jgi:hypothetical protein